MVKNFIVCHHPVLSKHGRVSIIGNDLKNVQIKTGLTKLQLVLSAQLENRFCGHFSATRIWDISIPHNPIIGP